MTNLDHPSNDDDGYGIDMPGRTPIIHPDPVLSNLQVPNHDYQLHPMSVQELSKDGITIRPLIHPDPVLSNLQVLNHDYQLHPMSVQELSKDGTTIRPSIYPDSILSNLQVPNHDYQLYSTSAQELSKNGTTIRPLIHPDCILLDLQVPNHDYQFHPMSIQKLSKDGTTIRPSIHPNPILSNPSSSMADDNSGSSIKMINSNNNRKRKISPSNKYESNWNNKLLELTDYKREFNHTNVPQRYTQNKPLGVWVLIQRKEYKHIEEGK